MSPIWAARRRKFCELRQRVRFLGKRRWQNLGRPRFCHDWCSPRCLLATRLQSHRVPPATNLSPLRLLAGPMEFGRVRRGKAGLRSHPRLFCGASQCLAYLLPGITETSHTRDDVLAHVARAWNHPSLSRNGEALPNAAECPFCQSMVTLTGASEIFFAHFACVRRWLTTGDSCPRPPHGSPRQTVCHLTP